MPNIKTIRWVLLLILPLLCVACEANDISTPNMISLPNSMIGTWQVTDVLFDQNDPRQGPGNKYFAPKYHGRIFTLSAKHLSINTSYDDPCDHPLLLPRNTTAAEIIGNSISTRIFSASGPTPKDMRLPFADDEPIKVLYLSCNEKLRSKDLGSVALDDLSNVVWFIKLANGKLAISWHEESILIVKRLTGNEEPDASYDCTKAGTDVEKTICASVGLAAYDKSLGQAYNMAQDYYVSVHDSTEAKKIKSVQRSWIKQRNACGTEKKCLKKAMDDRIVDIIYDLANYTYQHR